LRRHVCTADRADNPASQRTRFACINEPMKAAGGRKEEEETAESVSSSLIESSEKFF